MPSTGDENKEPEKAHADGSSGGHKWAGFLLTHFKGLGFTVMLSFENVRA